MLSRYVRWLSVGLVDAFFFSHYLNCVSLRNWFWLTVRYFDITQISSQTMNSLHLLFTWQSGSSPLFLTFPSANCKSLRWGVVTAVEVVIIASCSISWVFWLLSQKRLSPRPLRYIRDSWIDWHHRCRDAGRLILALALCNWFCYPS